MNPEKPNSPEGTGERQSSALSLIRDIKNGLVNTKNLSADDRRACVAHLTGEGASLAEIAEILQISERTVARDRRSIRESNAVEKSPSFTKEVIGRILLEADNVIARLRRATRDKETAASAKVDAELGVWSVTREFSQLLQSLGYLPSSPQEMNARLSLQIGNEPTLSGFLAEIERIQAISKACLPADAQSAALLEKTKNLMERISSESPIQTNEEVTPIKKEESL